jgi:uncharacterized protein (TIGR02246 family)
MRTTWWLTVALVFVIAAAALAQPAAPRGEGTVAALIEKHDEAMNQKDLDAVMALYAAGNKTVMIGTGPGERWVGKDEIRSAYVEFFKDYDKGSLARKCDWRSGEAQKDVAWGAAMCTMSDSLKDRKRVYDLNVSAVASNQGGQWLFRTSCERLPRPRSRRRSP